MAFPPVGTPDGCPYADDPDQQKIIWSVYDSQLAHNQKNADLANLKATIDAADKEWHDDGNMDGAFMMFMLAVLPQVTGITMDDQNCYAYDENTAASVNALETNCYNLELKGANYHVDANGNPVNEGMTPEDGEAFFEKQSDLLYDVSTTQWDWSAHPSEVFQGNFVGMPDLTASQIKDASVDTMSNQYDFNVIHGATYDSYARHTSADGDTTGKDIADKTNGWWTTNDGKDPVGKDGNALPQQLTSISQDFATVNNSANGQEQSANSNLQQSINETNTYVGDINSDYGSFAEEMKGITQNQKA